MPITTIERGKMMLRFNRKGFAIFWGEYLNRRTFQFHWAGYIPFYFVWGPCLDRRSHKLFKTFRK